MKIIAAANVVVLLSIAFIGWKWEKSSIKKFFWPALVLKLLAGIGLGLVYTYYYTVGDTFSYYKDGVELSALARTDFKSYCNFLWMSDESFPVWSKLNFQQPRALFLAKFTSILSLTSADNYWVITLYFSFVSFWCTWFLVTTLEKLYPSIAGVAVVAFLFFPSVVFWTSGLIKESLAMACLCFLTAVFLKLWRHERVLLLQWIAVPLFLWILWGLKYYYLAVFIAVVATALVMRLLLLPRINFKHWSLEFLTWFIVFMIPLYGASLVHPNFYPERFLEVIVSNYEAFVSISAPQDLIYYPNLNTHPGSIVQYTPKALFSGLFRPFLWESDNAFKLLIALENTALLVLFIFSVSQWKNFVQSNDRILLLSASVYIVLLCVFLSLSTPNFGTLSRYRVGFLPFFILLAGSGNPLVNRIHSFMERSFPRLVP